MNNAAVNKFFHGLKFALLLALDLGTELMGHMVT